MPGIHGLQHIEAFAASHFAYNNPVWTHTQGIANQVANGYSVPAFDVGRFCFHTHDMRLLQFKLCGIFNCDDAVASRDIFGNGIQKGGLS